jgi:phosphate starvation-inducible protein PhoH and related proteins
LGKRKEDNLLFGFKATITGEQQEFYDLMMAPCEEAQIIIVEAEAGTGKTQWATIGAKMREKKMRYIFAPVSEDEQGYLPGDIVDKSDPYVTPLKQALRKINEDPSSAIFDPRLNQFMNSKAWVFAHPHTFERGTNYEDETVVIDEFQNFTLHQLRKILTRCHDNCKIILIGNKKQCDLPNPEDSCFEPYVYHAQGYDWIKKVQLTKNFRGRVAKWADAI